MVLNTDRWKGTHIARPVVVGMIRWIWRINRSPKHMNKTVLYFHFILGIYISFYFGILKHLRSTRVISFSSSRKDCSHAIQVWNVLEHLTLKISIAILCIVCSSKQERYAPFTSCVQKSPNKISLYRFSRPYETSLGNIYLLQTTLPP